MLYFPPSGKQSSHAIHELQDDADTGPGKTGALVGLHRPIAAIWCAARRTWRPGVTKSTASVGNGSMSWIVRITSDAALEKLVASCDMI